MNGKEDQMTLLERYRVNNTDNECYDLNEQIVNKHMERNKLNCCDYLQLVRKNIRKPPYGGPNSIWCIKRQMTYK